MRLDQRVTKLEAASRERGARPCRWHDGAVIFPDSFPPGTTRRQAWEMCDAPGRCPASHGLFIDIREDDEEEETRPCD